MTIGKVALIAGVLVLIGAIAVLSSWSGSKALRVSRAQVASRTSPAPLVPRSATAPQLATSNAMIHLTPRQRFRRAGDYAAFVDEIAAPAGAGDPEAQFVMAQALRYCDQGIGRFFRKPDGSARSLNDAQLRWANRPAGKQAEIAEVYDRCHAFLDDSEAHAATRSWSQWLSNAAAAGYPAAEAKQADFLRAAALTSTNDALTTGAPSLLDNARDLAVAAAASGDPDALATMANWVDAKSRSNEESGELSAAWLLIACERGFDCGASSEWMRGVCNWDPQCGPAETYENILRRQFGSRFDQVQRLATDIGTAVDAKDAEGIRSHL